MDIKDQVNERMAKMSELANRQMPPALSGPVCAEANITEAYIGGHVSKAVNELERMEKLKRKKRKLEDEIKVLNNLTEWTATPQFPVFENVKHSRFHHCVEDIVFGKDEDISLLFKHINEAQVFLMQHDWSKAIHGTEAESGEFQYPADVCVFEFRISGRPYFTLCAHGSVLELMETPYGWAIVNITEAANKVWANSPDEFTLNQIRALCIFLEAGAVETEVVRAPHRLNRQRERRGKLPIFDWHVVNLAKRHRLPALSEHSEETRRSPRMHFRRGHWRHFDNHKTWINWQLVGDMDLGFVDKIYVA